MCEKLGRFILLLIAIIFGIGVIGLFPVTAYIIHIAPPWLLVGEYVCVILPAVILGAFMIVLAIQLAVIATTSPKVNKS